jgi:hypothetical protein
MIDGANQERERFVRSLAAAVPEAFADVDIEDEYGKSDGHWLAVMALEHVVREVQIRTTKFKLRRDRYSTVIPGSDELLRRFFDFIESELERTPGNRPWIMIGLEEGGAPWMEDLAAYAGPQACELMQRRRDAPRPG